MKQLLIITFLVWSSSILYSQSKGTYYFSNIGELCDKVDGTKKVKIKKKGKREFIEQDYNKLDNKWEKTNAYKEYDFINDSTIIIDSYINGELKNTIRRNFFKSKENVFSFIDYKLDSIVDFKGNTSMLLPLVLEGEIFDYYKNGNIRFKAIYSNNRLVSNERWKENGDKDIDNVYEYFQVEVKPTFSGGSLSDFISKNIKYPKEAINNNISGRVYIQFIVMEDGSLDGFRILRSIHPLLDEEAIRLFKESNMDWNPGMINGNNVRVEFNLPINFKL